MLRMKCFIKLYLKIFVILFGEDNRSTLQKMFGSAAKVKEQHQKEADALMQRLLSVSGTLLEAIEVLEKEIISMSEVELSAIE